MKQSKIRLSPKDWIRHFSNIKKNLRIVRKMITYCIRRNGKIQEGKGITGESP